MRWFTICIIPEYPSSFFADESLALLCVLTMDGDAFDNILIVIPFIIVGFVSAWFLITFSTKEE